MDASNVSFWARPEGILSLILFVAAIAGAILAVGLQLRDHRRHRRDASELR